MKRLLALAMACAPPPKPPVHVEPVTLSIGAQRIVEVGDTAFVLDGSGVAVMRNDVVLARGPCPGASDGCHWLDTAAIAAPTGEGRWAIVIAGGRLLHVTMSAEVEDVTERLGLRERPHHIAAAGHMFAAIGDRELAVTRDGVHLMRFPRVLHVVPGQASVLGEPMTLAAAGSSSPARSFDDSLAVARDRVAIGTAGNIELWDLAASVQRTIPLADAFVAFLDADSDHPRLVATNATGTFVESGGTMRRIDAPAAIATAGSRLWLSDADGLAYTDGYTLTRTDVRGGPFAGGSPTGAVWIGGADHLQRYSPDRPTDDPAWQAQVAPVFARVCGHCHVPGGEAGIDLSTPASWNAERDEIRRRVLVTNTMPPAGTMLSDDDRAAIEGWLAHAGK